jgi:hypothetical protein
MLSEKMDSYDKITSLGCDLSKLQSQVDLSMHSIQALQQEQIVLVKAVHRRVPGSGSEGRIMGSSLIPSDPILLLQLHLVHLQFCNNLREVTHTTLLYCNFSYMVHLMEVMILSTVALWFLKWISHVLMALMYTYGSINVHLTSICTPSLLTLELQLHHYT